MKSMANRISSFFRRARRLSRPYTPVTVAVRLIIGQRKNAWFLTSLLYGIPVFVVLSGFLFARKNIITHDVLTILLIYLAAIWTWVGPVFIWRYEHVTTTEYWAMCRKVVKSRQELYRLRKSLKMVLKEKHGVLLMTIWCLLIVGTFIASYDFMKGFGVTGKTDIWWYILVIGVAIYAFFTGIGFLLVIRTFLLIRNFLPLDTNIDPYHPDQRGGLGFFGKILSETSLMFASGALYIPILLKLHLDIYADTSFIVLLIIGIYVVMIVLSFLIPIWLIHKKLVKEKFRRLLSLSISLRQMQGRLGKEGIEKYLHYKVYRDQYYDVNRIITWPFDMQNVTTVLASVALPIFFTILQIYLTGNR